MGFQVYELNSFDEDTLTRTFLKMRAHRTITKASLRTKLSKNQSPARLPTYAKLSRMETVMRPYTSALLTGR